MFAAGTRKSLKSLTWQEFVENKIADVDTWPYLPVGDLKQHLPMYAGFNIFDQRTYEEDVREASRFVEVFSDKQKMVLGWIFTSFIAVLGNLAVNLAFALPVLSGNIFWMFLVSAVVFGLVVLYLMFLPRVSMLSKFMPSYVSFPRGYEQHISKRPCNRPSSQDYFSSQTLDQLVINFGNLVQTAVFKDSLRSALRNVGCVRLSRIWQSREISMISVEISTRGVKTWFDPRAAEKMRTELRNIVDAMFQARLLCSAYKFELDFDQWNIRGCDFIEAVSQWNFDEVQAAILHELKTS